MYKSKLKWLIIGLSAASLLLILLFLNFEIFHKKSFYSNGGFKRTRIYPNFTLVKNIGLTPGTYSIIGIFKNQLYVQDFKRNLIYGYSIDKSSKDSTQINLSALYKEFVPTNNASLDSLTGYIYVYAEQFQSIFSYNLNTKHIGTKTTSPIYLEKLFGVKGTAVVIQKPAPNYKFTFSKGMLDTRSAKIAFTISSNLKLLEMVDDGNLLNVDNNFLYISFYKNAYYYLDSNLNKVYESRLIDTVSQGPKVSLLGSQGTGRLEYTSPVRMCNPHSNFANNFLFVESKVAANSDDYDQFKESIVVDKYDVAKKRYIGTYFLPKTDGLQVDDFLIRDKIVYTIYDNRLLIYESSITL